MLNRPHSDAQCIFLRCECAATTMTARGYASSKINRFEAQTQRDIAEVRSSASAADKRPAVVEVTDGSEILVEDFA